MNSPYTCVNVLPQHAHCLARRQTKKQLELSLPRSLVINLYYLFVYMFLTFY